MKSKQEVLKMLAERKKMHMDLNNLSEVKFLQDISEAISNWELSNDESKENVEVEIKAVKDDETETKKGGNDD